MLLLRTKPLCNLFIDNRFSNNLLVENLLAARRGGLFLKGK